MTKYCPKCGRECNDGTKFCVKCGYNFKNPKPKIKISIKNIIIAILISLILISGAYLVLLLI